MASQRGGRPPAPVARPGGATRGIRAPTVKDMSTDPLLRQASEYWSPSATALKGFSKQVVEDIYYKEKLPNFTISRIMVLEFSCYLENYLWPNFDAKTSSNAHIMSVMLMVNEKFREGVGVWGCFHSREKDFPAFFERVVSLPDDYPTMTVREKTIYIIFLIHCFSSLEDEMVRKQCLRLVSLPVWNSLTPGRLERELKAHPQLQRHWKLMKQKEAKEAKVKEAAAAADGAPPKPAKRSEVTFMPGLIRQYLAIVDTVTDTQPPDPSAVAFCERFVEFLIDLLAQLPTRRFFRVIVLDLHAVIRSRLSVLARLPQGRLFNQLLTMLKFYVGFEINDHTGTSLTEDEMVHMHCSKLSILQRLAWKYFQPKLRDFALTNIASIETRAALTEYFSTLSDTELLDMCARLRLLSKDPTDKWTREFLTEVLVSTHEKRLSQLDAINEYSLYPNELILFDESVVPTETYLGDGCLALPKLNLQFLTFHDYLLRNFNLFRLESTYEIREDVEDAVRRLNPQRTYQGETVFNGWARMAIPIKSFRLTEVAKPLIGENKPALVKGEVTYSITSMRGGIRSEWEGLHQHDVVFLLTIRAVIPVAGSSGKPPAIDRSIPFREQFGLSYIRGCEVIEVLDGTGNLMNEMGRRDSGKPPVGDVRTLRVAMDAAQYQTDLANMATTGEDVYSTFNVLMRRKPKENNFKAVLETIRDLMNSQCVIPDWLHDVFLGYGDPGAAAYQNMPEKLKTFDFNDTFVGADHIVAAFPANKVKFTTDDEAEQVPPFRVTFPDDEAPEEEKDVVVVEPYVPPHPGPYPQDKPKQNKVPFTPVQVEAIKSGMSHGLTMVVGPPGTGKTDVAVQIISNLYHNFPEQRTLIVTHSNQALNDLFEKIMERDVNEIHLLRLGMGEKELTTDKDFGKIGRVNFMLSRRLERLADVERLARSVGVEADVGYTCETAQYFFLFHVLARWEEYLSKCAATPTAENVSKLFPFTNFFSTAPQPLFNGQSYEADMRIAEGCFRHLKHMFSELEQCRAFELLRSSFDRGNYLVTKQAKVIAMTCTHAALKRRDLVGLGFKYDNVLMEESAQILEIETFIPMLLQDHEDGVSRLKRVILIGDHNQLPPVVKNLAFQKYSHLDQSLFTRFIRLGVPAVELNYQGRARPSIADLYNWRYKQLRNLPNTLNNTEYHLANAGFSQEVQLIDVGDLDGVGESEPTPYFYQNLAEAEYVVAVFQYMRLLGYPGSRISILTTYNGQKHLIRDVINQRCAWNPFFGQPARVTTVDRFQGQQNDYILLSLVRTRAVGHLRDVRRLVVAMSRARLGLYVFCRKSLFENCYELTPTFSQLLQRPTRLHLILGERFPSSRPVTERGIPTAIEDVAHMTLLVYNMSINQHEQHNILQQKLTRQWTSHFGDQAPPPTEAPAPSRAESSAQEPPVPMSSDGASSAPAADSAPAHNATSSSADKADTPNGAPKETASAPAAQAEGTDGHKDDSASDGPS